jgi:hypothetical protein
MKIFHFDHGKRDYFANLWSDGLGNPLPAVKEGGKFHKRVRGYLPHTKVRRMAANAGKLAEATGMAKIVFVMMLTWYVTHSCC